MKTSIGKENVSVLVISDQLVRLVLDRTENERAENDTAGRNPDFTKCYFTNPSFKNRKPRIEANAQSSSWESLTRLIFDGPGSFSASLINLLCLALLFSFLG